MSSLLTQLRNKKSLYNQRSGSGNRALKAYNEFYQSNYKPAYDAAFAYKPTVDQKYSAYRQAFDAAKGEYDRMFASEKAAYQGAIQTSNMLYGQYQTADQNLKTYQRQNLDPYEGEYAKRTTAYTTAYNQAIKGAEGQYTQQANQLLRNLNVAQDNRRRDYGSTKAFRTSSYNRKYNAASKALTNFNEEYSKNLYYVNQQGIGNTVYNPTSGFVQRYDSARFTGGDNFEYKIGGQKYNIRQAPSSFDVSFQFQVQDRIKKYNFYQQVIEEGNRDRFGLPSYVNKDWMQRENKTLTSYLTPETGLVDVLKRSGEKSRAKAAEAYTSVDLLIKEKDIAEKSLRDFVSVSQADYVFAKTGGERKAYQDFTATSLEDFAKPIATEASKRQYTEMQEYVPTLNQARQGYNQYKANTFDVAYNRYNQYLQGNLATAKQNYLQVANDTGFIDRRSGSQKAEYLSSKSKFDKLKANYQQLEPVLSSLQSDYETSVAGLGDMRSDITRLEKSVNIELDPRKSGVRVGRRESLLTRGSKRAGATR